MLLHYAFRLFCNMAIFLLRGKRVIYGKENMLQEGAHLIVVNHMSILDSILVLISLPPRRIRFMIGEKWENHPVGKPLGDGLGGIFVNRHKVDQKAIRATLAVLKNGEPLGLAPEGHRSPIGQVVRPKNGASYLAYKASVPLVPVGLVRTEKFFRNALFFRPTTIEMHIGEPIELPPLQGKIRQRELNAYTDYIMLHILKLLPETYYGYYRMTEHPALEDLKNGRDHWKTCLLHHGIDPDRIIE